MEVRDVIIAIACLVLGFGAGRLRRHFLPSIRRRTRAQRVKQLLKTQAKASSTDHVIQLDKSQAIQFWLQSSTQAAELVRDRVKWFAGASTVPLAVTASLLAVTKEPDGNLVAAILFFILALYASLLPLAGLSDQMHTSTRKMGLSIVNASTDASMAISLPYVWPKPSYRVMEIVALVLLAAGLLFLAQGVLR